MENWLASWTAADYFGFIAAMVGLASFFVSAVVAQVTIKLHPTPEKRALYSFAIFACAGGLIVSLGGTTYLVYRYKSARGELVAVKATIRNSLNPTPQPSPTLTPTPAHSVNIIPPHRPESVEVGTLPEVVRVTSERIRFARGGTSAVITRTINRVSEHEFLLEARSEQFMSVSLSADGTTFCVFAPDGQLLGQEVTAKWTGVLPQSGDYRVRLIPNGHESLYRLEVSIY